jgi:hypothetical protein
MDEALRLAVLVVGLADIDNAGHANTTKIRRLKLVIWTKGLTSYQPVRRACSYRTEAGQYLEIWN